MAFVPATQEGVAPWVVAASMAMAAGVMIYIAVTEMFAKSEEAFGLAGHGEVTAQLYANLAFFGGCAFMTAASQSVTCPSNT